MSQTVRVGLVSTSWWAEQMFLPSLRSHPQAQVAAICGRNRTRAEEIAGKYGVPAVFADYRHMIEGGDLDALVVAVPDDMHAPVTMAALDAGLHILCEKPLAANAQQALAMAEKARAAGVKHMVLYTFRWMPYLQYARHLIDQGYVGRPYHCEFRYLLGYARSGEYMWRLDRERANGLLGDIGSHLIDTARWLVGDITSVSAQLPVFVDHPSARSPNSLIRGGGQDAPEGANDYASLLVQFAGGARGVIQASGVAHLGDRSPKQQVRIYGDEGSLEIDVPPFGPAADAAVRAVRSNQEQFQTLEVPHTYWGAADPSDAFSVFTKSSAGPRHFIDAILGSTPAAPDFYDGYKAQQVIDAALESDATGCAVKIAASE